MTVTSERASTPKRVPTIGGGVVAVTAPLRHLCPFVDEVDEGEVRLSWSVNGMTFELHSLAAYLDSFAEEKVSHEELTVRIFRELGSSMVGVTTEWRTAGMTVTVSAGYPVGDES